MYKWHVPSSFGRIRPLGSDFSRVSDGIAASLRQFHVSALNHNQQGQNAPPRSQAERSASAAAEITSLQPAVPRGIDARSLAATPMPRFTIRRMDMASAGDRGGRGASFSRGRGRGGGGMMGLRGRGGARGGARGGTRGRGGAKRAKRKPGPRMDGDSTIEKEPMTAEEKAYLDSVEMGVPRAFPAGTTNLQDLIKDIPAMAMSTAPAGNIEGIRDRMRTLGGQVGNEVLSSRAHGLAYTKGNGTFFVDDADLAKATRHDRALYTPKSYDVLDQTERQMVLQTLAAGQYPPFKQPTPRGDPLTNIDTYTQQNETYLCTDAKTLKMKVQTLLPARRAVPAPRKEMAK